MATSLQRRIVTGQWVWLMLGCLAVLTSSVRGQDTNGAPGEMPEIQPTSVAPPQPAGSAAEAVDEVDTEDAARVERTENGTFELHIQNADVRSVLRQLSTQGRRNIVCSQEVKGTVTVDLYDVTFQEAIEAILHSSDTGYREKGSFIYVYTNAELAELDKAERTIETRVFRLAYITSIDAQVLVEKLLSDEGSLTLTPPPEVGIPTTSEDTGGKSHASEEMLVVRDYVTNLEDIASTLAKVDVRPEQVLIEATILAATLTEDNALGIDLEVLAGVDFKTFGVTSDLASNPTGGAVANLDRTQSRLNTSFSGNVPDTLGSPMQFGVISNNVALFLQALEAVTDTTVIANPKLLVVNKQRGEVLIGQSEGYLTTTVTDTTATQTVEFLETGTRLIVRPFVGNDGFIRMEIHPEDSTGDVRQIGGDNGPVLPNKTTTEVTSNVMVRDGRTIVIGGLFREETTLRRRQVPGVGDWPVVGMLFRSTVDTTDRQEVIILITPHILKHESAEVVGERLKMEAERSRIGARKGLQWWSRPRLAEMFIVWARNDIANGNRSRALWNLDLALALQPRMAEAIHLKEQITGLAYWADQPRSARGRYLVERMITEELDTPAREVITPYRPLRNERIQPESRENLGIPDRGAEWLDWPAPTDNPLPLDSLAPVSSQQPRPVQSPQKPDPNDVPPPPPIEEPQNTSPEPSVGRVEYQPPPPAPPLYEPRPKRQDTKSTNP